MLDCARGSDRAASHLHGTPLELYRQAHFFFCVVGLVSVCRVCALRVGVRVTARSRTGFPNVNLLNINLLKQVERARPKSQHLCLGGL